MDTQTPKIFDWYDFIPHILAGLTIFTSVLVFASSFTGLAVLQFTAAQRWTLGIGTVVIALMLAQWISTDKAAMRAARAAANRPRTKEVKPAYEYMSFRVAGVSHPNDDGSSRQELLRAYRFGDAPFETTRRVTLRDVAYNGEPAFQVLANGHCIGWVPKDEVPELSDKWPQLDCITGLDVTGGGFYSDTGKQLSYGATLSIRFKS